MEFESAVWIYSRIEARQIFVDLGFGIWDLGFGIWGLGFGIWDLGFGIRDLGFGIWDLLVVVRVVRG